MSGNDARGHDERRHADGLGVDAERELRSSSRCRRARPRTPRPGSTPPCAQTSSRQLAAASVQASSRRRSRAVGSSIVAEMRVITSAPKGCWRLSIDAHRDGRARREVEQRGDDGRRAEVEGDARADARSCRPGSTSIRRSSTTHAGDAEVGARAGRAGGGAARRRSTRSSRSSIASSRRSRSVRWSCERRLVELDVALLQRRAAGSPGGRRRRSPPSAA